MAQSTCSVPACVNPKLARSWCNAHYGRWLRYGTPTGGGPLVAKPSRGSFESRFWAKVRKGDGCWEWQGDRSTHGYGKIWSRKAGTAVAAHRASWELHNGPIPDGLFACHRCDNPPCVNPAHLFLGTQTDNMRDASAKGRAARKPRGRWSRDHDSCGDCGLTNRAYAANGLCDLCYIRSRRKAEGMAPRLNARISPTEFQPQKRHGRKAA